MIVKTAIRDLLVCPGKLINETYFMRSDGGGSHHSIIVDLVTRRRRLLKGDTQKVRRPEF